MDRITYIDFDLLIERRGAGYTARVLESPAGEASAPFSVPFAQDEIENFFLQIGHTRLIESSQVETMRGFGRQLFEAVFTDEVRDRLRTSLGEVNRRGAGLRIRLRLSDIPELGNLPWEFMYDPSLSRFLVLSVETPIVRYLEVPQVIQPLAIQPPLRILTMISSPKDFPKLDVEQEWENLQEALSGLESRGLVALTRLEKATLPALQQQLRRGEYHIFHFIGHGTFSKRAQDGMLLLEDEMRGGRGVSGRDLGTLLHDHRPLRLVMLNACEGARTSLEDQFAGSAQGLMQQGIPAVIAMQFRITDQASIILAREFYGALADGYPVDAALTEARKALKTQGNELEWGTPVLYLRAPDGQIFDVASIPAITTQTMPDIRREQVERVYTEALEAFYLGKWEEAARNFQAVVATEPGYKDAAAKLEATRKRMKFEGLDQQAHAAEQAGDWQTASSTLETLSVENPERGDLSARLKTARRQKELAELYAEARQLAQAEKWQAVISIFEKIRAMAPNHPDPERLLTTARRQASGLKRQSELETLYNRAIAAMEAGDWKEARQALRGVRAIQNDYRESERLLQKVNAELGGGARGKKRKPKAELVEPAAPVSARFEWLILALLVGFTIAKALAQILGDYIYHTLLNAEPSAPIAASFYMLPAGILTGLILWWFLSTTHIALRGKEVLGIITACAAGETVFIGIGVYLGIPSAETWAWVLLWAIVGLIIGLTLALIIRRAETSFGRKQFALTVVGWSAAFAIGIVIGQNLRDTLIQYFGDALGFTISITIEQTVAGLIGGWVMLSQLEIGKSRGVNWKTVLAGTVGFALGNLFISLFTSYNEWNDAFSQLFIWGLIGGVSLGFPSRDFKRYALLGLLGGAGFGLGHLAWTMLGEPSGFRAMVIGGVMGLFLGISTKRIPGILALSISFAIAHILRSELNSLLLEYYMNNLAENLVYALTAGIFGGLIGLAWSFLNSRGVIPASKPAGAK